MVFAFSTFLLWTLFHSTASQNGYKLFCHGYCSIPLFGSGDTVLRHILPFAFATIPSGLSGLVFWHFYRGFTTEQKVTGRNVCFLLVGCVLAAFNASLFDPIG